MNDQKPVKIALNVTSEDGTPLRVLSIEINDTVFVPNTKVEEEEVITEEEPLVAAAVVMGGVSSTAEEEELSIATNPGLLPDDTFNTLEEFGGKAFYHMFWGKLSYSPLPNNQTKVTFQGNEDVFDSSFLGCWLEPSRIHKCSFDYPDLGRNYFPGAMSVVYSRVIDVLDGKNLIVDFGYNGGDLSSPKTISDQDGIVFFDNKFALESWSKSLNRKDILMATPGKIYGVLGMPNIEAKENSNWYFKQKGEGERPGIHLMMSDNFTGDKFGRGIESPNSFKDTFGDNGRFFTLPSKGKVEVDFDWQFIPPTYSQIAVQYGSMSGLFFYDSAGLSAQYGVKRVANFDQFRIRKAMKKELGFVREGVSFAMPNQGYCNGGGIHDGKDITEFCTYRFEGDWLAKDLNNMKARTSGGLKVEWIGRSETERGNFLETESLKVSRFDKLKIRFVSSNRIEVQDDSFSWYHLASQEWTGGTSTGSEATHIEIEGKRIGLNTNGDFWLVFGEGNLDGRDFSAHQINIFDKIPKNGDKIAQDLNNFEKNSLIGKQSDKIFEIWGWAIQEGDEFSFEGKTYKVIQTERKWKTWAQFATQYPNPDGRLNKNDRRITYTQIELDQPISSSLAQIEFKVEKSGLEPLLDGRFRSDCSAVWIFGNDAPGHLMYIDYNVNLVMRNINICGLIRSTSKTLWADTTQELSGSISKIPVSRLGAGIWKKGDRLQLCHPESGLLQEVEVITSYSGNEGDVLIKPVQLSQPFPKNSIVTGLFSLCSEAIFDHVYFINEDGSPNYSERIDYRPQGLRLRQLITKNQAYRVKILGGRISWYSNLDNRFEPEIALSEKPHLVNPKSVVPILLNPSIEDGKGASFGFQFKQTGKNELFLPNRIVLRNGRKINIDNSILMADLYLEGDGELSINNVISRPYVENGQEKSYGFNIRVKDRFVETSDLSLVGSGGKAALMIETPYPIGVIKVKLSNWELFPGVFNQNGFINAQDRSQTGYADFIQVST